MLRLLMGLAVVMAAGAMGVTAAYANPPTMTSLTVMNRHPGVVFSAPKADSVSIYFASKPDRATDGNFLSENVEDSEFLTADEIQAGHWTDANQLDPGTYYVLLKAAPDFAACWNFDTASYDPSCADGFSDLTTLTVPRPTVRYTVGVTALRYLHSARLAIAATPLGVSEPYKVCYLTAAKRKRCVAGTLPGYSWNSSATDSLEINTRPLAKTGTKFTWWVDGKTVGSKTVRVT